MASFKEERAEAAAKLAAKDIGDINRANESEEGYTLNSELNFKQARAEAAAKLAAKDLEDVKRAKEESAWREPRVEENKPGVIGSMFRAVQHAKEAVVGKPHETTDQNSPGVYEKVKETKDAAASKVGEYADYAGQKARETKDATKQKAGEYADYASQKAKETSEYAGNKAMEAKDYTAEKAKEGKDTATGKLGELKDRAMGFFTANSNAKKDDSKVSAREEHDAAARGGEKLVIRMEESRPGAVADALRAADRALGAGDVQEEGVIHVERRREKM
ncbi:hypothetical protein Fmac_006442 [Flemingia macrophylla]|uniref:Uncharacterized protein n=1 Tax=Flemingia macrophylla TaxID=520843 RepID=A0ABD1NAK8_9FABA